MKPSQSTDAEPRKRPLALKINGERVSTDVDPETPLLWFLRDRLDLKGTKYGCGTGYCGACLVLIDGEPNHACMVPLHRVGDRSVMTIEGLASDGAKPIIDAWVAGQVPQCGYCQPAQIVAAAAVLINAEPPTAQAIDAAMDDVLCRCGTYQRIRRAIAAVAAGEVEVPVRSAPAGELVVAEPRGVALNDWVSIEPDGSAVFLINHSEMGQGSINAIATLIAEELEVDLDQVRVANAPAASQYVNPTFGVQLTGGSSTVSGEWQRLRSAGASAREALIAAALDVWDAERGDCRAARGAVEHVSTGRVLGYADLAAAAARLEPPVDVELKPPSEFRLIGRASVRADVAPMTTGAARYGMDITVPDMLVASVARAPAIGAALEAFDASAAVAVDGVVDAVAIDSGVAVVASDFWAASQGRDKLETRWTRSESAPLDTAAIYAALDESLNGDGKVTDERGAVQRALTEAERTIQARYRTPYLAHVTIEPPNCIADVRADRCDLWVGTQDQTETQKTAVRLTGLKPEQVHVHTVFLGGGFGRRLETDFVAEAVELSAKLGRPVQVVWTRDDDLVHDKFRPAHCVALEAGLDPSGMPTAWAHRIAGPPVALGNCDMPYAIANFREEKIRVRSPLPVGAWRGVGAVQNAFAVESFIDELAHAAGQDPLEYRRALLEHSPRHVGVLDAVADMIGWHDAPPAGRGRGVAVYYSFGSWTAQAAEVSCDRDEIRVHRIACALDCGQALNPDTIRAQIEGGIAIGLSAALKERIDVVDGCIKQTTLADYPILRYSEMPDVDVRIIAAGESPGGVGEPPVPPVAPAVANAVFALTGRRLRELPLRL